MVKIDAKQLAEWAEQTFQRREKSWDGERYVASWQDAAAAIGVPREWIYPVQMLLFDGYADTWDWAAELGIAVPD